MKVTKISNIAALFGALLGLSLNVSALPLITGGIGMGGGFDPVDSTGAVTSLDLAEGIDFTPNTFFVTWNSTGSFAGLGGQTGTIKDLQFGSLAGPVDDFWSVAGFTFDLTSVSRVPFGDPSQYIALQGHGIISAAGYQNTGGMWTFTGNGPTGTFSWSAGTGATGVPEPMALALIGIGLAGFGIRGMVKRRKQVRL